MTPLLSPSNAHGRVQGLVLLSHPLVSPNQVQEQRHHTLLLQPWDRLSCHGAGFMQNPYHVLSAGIKSAD